MNKMFVLTICFLIVAVFGVIYLVADIATSCGITGYGP